MLMMRGLWQTSSCNPLLSTQSGGTLLKAGLVTSLSNAVAELLELLAGNCLLHCRSPGRSTSPWRGRWTPAWHCLCWITSLQWQPSGRPWKGRLSGTAMIHRCGQLWPACPLWLQAAVFNIPKHKRLHYRPSGCPGNMLVMMH